MEFVDFSEANTFLGPPVGMTEEQVGTIRAYSTQKDDKFTFKEFRERGGHYFIVMAKFTQEEIDEFNKTGCMCLKVLGTGFPPVAMWPAVPEENQNPES